ncbi:hypothetical protein AOZ06_17475 [Kibdelosporangium phytohabitans]|uniref:Uncharacterized protein n=1 Tax=Kibdelosporangium phytohabitans TaxID=860235 RepID=A0A0N9I216_9PSEU|nr:hypothetical protein AOZ06_17475 [Kibdelosporangium phytohabitans]
MPGILQQHVLGDQAVAVDLELDGEGRLDDLAGRPDGRAEPADRDRVRAVGENAFDLEPVGDDPLVEVLEELADLRSGAAGTDPRDHVGRAGDVPVHRVGEEFDDPVPVARGHSVEVPLDDGVR